MLSNGVLHLVSPVSLRSWFGHFVTFAADDRVEWLGEEERLPPAVRERMLALHGRSRLTVIHSSHHTLIRDAALGTALQAAGGRVIHQTPAAARAGADKFAMKRLFDAQQLPNVPWRHSGDGVGAAEFAAAHHGPFVRKRRRGTEGKELRLAPAPATLLAPDVIEEPFVAGTEYSVVVFRAEGRRVTFPSVWKGETRHDLLPPYRRLRLCPAPNLTAGAERELRALSLRAAEAMGSVGFAEVELVVAADGRPRLVEVNPRIAGTMRMSALAAGVRIFDLPAVEKVTGDLPASRCVVELPASGEAWNDPRGLTFCTSRLTVAADEWELLPARLQEAVEHGARLPVAWRELLDATLPTRTHALL